MTLLSSLASKATAAKRPSVQQEAFLLGSKPACPGCISTAALDELGALSDAGKMRAVVQQAYPLDDFAAAVGAEMAGNVTGKIVIQIA